MRKDALCLLGLLAFSGLGCTAPRSAPPAAEADGSLRRCPTRGDSIGSTSRSCRFFLRKKSTTAGPDPMVGVKLYDYEGLRPDGISLDFIRHFVYWESVDPENFPTRVSEN